VEVDGTNDKLLASDNTGGLLQLKTGKVALGTTTEELLQLVSEFMDKLQNDTFNLGYPSLKAQNNEYTALKTRLDSIKGTL